MLKLLTGEERYDYKCFDELKRLFNCNEDFKNFVVEGYSKGEISGFNEELWDRIKSQNIRKINSFEDVFRDGANIGYCTVASKQLSYSLDECYICGGVLPLLKGTTNCEDGSHTWIVCDNRVIDTTLMLIMTEEYANKMGYLEQNRYDPNVDPVYLAAKEFTNDKTINGGRSK